MNDPKRQEIKNRIAAAEARNEEKEQTFLDSAGEKAIEAKDKFTEFAKEHPIATVAGGIGLGILIAGMFPSARRQARQTGAKAAGLAAIASEIAMAYAAQAMDTAGDLGRAGADRLDDFGDTVGDTARSLKRSAGFKMGNAADSAHIARRDAGKAISRALRRH